MKIQTKKLNKIGLTLLTIAAVFGLFGAGRVLAGNENIHIKDGFELELQSEQTAFAAVETPEMEFRFKKQRGFFGGVGAFFKGIVTDEYKNVEIKAELADTAGSGLTPEVIYDKNGKFSVKLSAAGREIKPGKRTVRITVKDANMTGDETISFTQDFLWGVLAFNPDQSMYRPGDTAYLQAAVLDDEGDTICTADLKIEIDEPGWGKTVLSTADGTITRNPACGLNNVIDAPDYYANYELEETGIYNITVIADTVNGQRVINDKIEVKKELPFIIRREGPTRINPKANYSLKIHLKSEEGYRGDIIESVPAEFSIFNFQFSNNTQYPISNIKIEDDKSEKRIIIPDIELKPGEDYWFSYEFDALDISPEFYLLGPLNLTSNVKGQMLNVASEARHWQIASDNPGAIGHQYFYYNNAVTKTINFTTDNWQEVTEYLIASTTFTAGKDYLIVVNFSIHNSNVNANSMAQVRHGTTAFDDSVWRWETDRNLLADIGHGYQYFTVWRAVAGEDIHVDVSNAGGTDYTVRTEDFQAFALNLSDDLTQNTDWYFASTTVSGDLPNGSWTVNGASVTIDGGGNDWMIVGMGHLLSDSTSADFMMRLYNTTDAQSYNEVRYETEDAADERSFMLMSGVNISGTKTWRMDAQTDTATTHDWTYSSIFALNLEKFQSHAIKYDTTSTSITPLDNWVETASTTFQAKSAGDTLIWSQEVNDTAENTKNTYSRMLIDGSPVPSGFADTKREQPHGATDEDAHHNFYLGSLSQGLRQISVQMNEDTDVSGPPVADIHNLVVFSMELKTPPIGTFDSAAQRTDGSGITDIAIVVEDNDWEPSRAKLEWATSTDCSDFFSHDPTLDPLDANATSTYGDPTVYNSTVYQIGDIIEPEGIIATGGTITEDGGYVIHTFTGDGTFEVTSGFGDIEVLVVGGGAAGGTGGTAGRGGGGSGGIVYDDAYAVGSGSYTVTIGTGGTPGTTATVGGPGGNSVFSTLTALGGGGAGPHATAGTAGGSGGGGSGYSGEAGGAGNQPGSPSGGYGNAGGASYDGGGVAPGRNGGGGGAGAVGQAGQITGGGNGGAGVEFSQFAGVGGSPAGWFGGGGGGGASSGYTAGNGGNGGGGAGSSTGVGTSGTDNTGGGGGGSISTGGAGGSGVVIVRYPAPESNPYSHILTDSGPNTVNVDWFSDTDLPNANGETYCLRLTTNDFRVDQSPLATTTLTIDNTAPSISSLVTDNLMYSIGDTLRATVTVASESGNLTIGPGSSINGGTVTNILKSNNTTFTVDYTVASGETDRATGTIPYSVSLVDPYGNKSATSSNNFANGSIDANAPSISSVIAPDLMYGIGDTLTATITVSSDASIYSLDVSSVNWATSSTGNFRKINNTTYTVDYTVAASDVDRASGTIPVYIVLRDIYGNMNGAWTTLTSNASVDANAPVITTVYITNGSYAIGDSIDIIVNVNKSLPDYPNYSLGPTTVNGVSIIPSQFVYQPGSENYRLTYTVSDGDTDRDTNEIPVSIVFTDWYGNSNATFTLPENNNASIDAHRPEVTEITIPNSSYKIGDTVTATITITGDDDYTNYTLNTASSSINWATSSTGNLIKISSTTLTIDYTVTNGDYDQSAGDVPVTVSFTDGVGNTSVPYDIVTVNTAAIDANRPVIQSVSFNPSSGLLGVGSTTIATITMSGNETGCTAGTTMNINTKSVLGSFAESGGGSYTVSYTVAEGDPYHPDGDDLPVYFYIFDANGNESDPVYSQTDALNRPGVDGDTPQIANVIFTPTAGTLKVGDTATATITAVGGATGLLAGPVMTVNGEDVSGTFVAVGGGQYHVTYTVGEGHADVDDTTEDLAVNLTIRDSAWNISDASTTPDISNRPGVDGHTPVIANVIFTPGSGTLKVGDTATATIYAVGGETGALAGPTMTINGVNVAGTFSEVGGGEYRVTYTVIEGHADINDATEDLPLYLTLKDIHDNVSVASTTVGIANGPGVDGHTPAIANVIFTPGSGTLKVGDTATATIYAVNGEVGLFAGPVMTINGVNVAATFLTSGYGIYTVTYTVSESDADVDDATEDLAIDLTIRDGAYNVSDASTTPDIANRPGVDGHSPTISGVSIPNVSMKVGDIVTATTTVGDDGGKTYVLISGSIGGFALGGFTRENATTYTATFTVTESGADVAAGSDIPVSSLVIRDPAFNESTAYNTPISQGSDPIDANTPTVPGDLSFIDHGNDNITLKLGATTTETNFAEYKIFYKIGSAGATEIDSVWDQTDDGNLSDKFFNGNTTVTDLATGTTYYFNIWAYDTAGNKAQAATELQASTNYNPDEPSDLVQKLNDNYTVVANNAWAIDQSMVLSASTTDQDNEFIDYYYEVIAATGTLTTATTVPATSCNSGTGYVECAEKIWKYSTGPAWFNEDWLYRKQIVIDSDLVEDDLEDFPFLISNTDDDLMRNALSDGSDIIFTSADGVTEINYERKLYNPADGQLIAWVKTDLSSSTDTFLYMYYGNGDIAYDHSTTTGVWDTDYLGVWHMDEPPTGAADDIKDSSGYSHHMTSYNMDSAKRIVTNTGYAYDFDGAGDYLEDTDGENYVNGLSQFTVELWLKSDLTATDRGFIIGEPPAGNDSFFTLRYDEAGANMGNTYHNLVKGAITITGPTEKQYESSAGVQTTNWQHLVFRWQSGGQYEVLINGQYDSYTFNSPAGVGTTQGASMLRIGQGGKDTTAALGWDGLIDEVRISSVYRTDAWEKTAYNNQSNLTDFALLGAEDAVRIFNLPESSDGYKWQVMACDSYGACSEWTHYNDTTPNFKVDNTPPTPPGDLTENSKTSTSVTLNLTGTTTESFFSEYRIYYKEYDGTPVSTGNSLFDPSGDENLGDIFFFDASTTTVPYLTADTEYEFNIWAFDESGQSASATPVRVTTDIGSNRPTGSFTGAAEKNDASGRIDISILVNDADNNPSRARLDYVLGSDCDFTSPLDPTLDATPANVSATNEPKPLIDNQAVYQIGTGTDWILTAPAANTVSFDWLSAIDQPHASSTYCLRLTVNDGVYDQLVLATTTVYVDNYEPSAPGALSLNTRHTDNLILDFGATTTEDNFAEYKIFYKVADGSAPTEASWVLSSSTDDNLGDKFFDTAATTTITGLSAGTIYSFAIWAYDAYGNKASSSFVDITTNYLSAAPANLEQYKNDGVTIISNGTWAVEDNVKLSASALDSDTSEIITLYFELHADNDPFTTATTTPYGGCAWDEAWSVCNSKIWATTSPAGDYSVTPFTAMVNPTAISSSSAGYKWQVLACDDDGVCASNWTPFNASTPNFKVDFTPPTAPGNLSILRYTSTSTTIAFGASSIEDNFYQYAIYYKENTGGVLETDTSFGSSTDSIFLLKNYGGATTTRIDGLNPGTLYYFNIWAYDEAGNKAAAPIEVSTTTNNLPTGSFTATSTKLNGGGGVDLSISISDADGQNSRAKIEYEAGSGCAFASAYKATIDTTDANATSTYDDAKVNNSNDYQIGNSSGWITTVSANAVHFDWLSETDLVDEEGNYCLRLTANDQIEDQAAPDTVTVYIDNKEPSAPSTPSLYSRAGNSITLSIGTTTETNFLEYRIYYKIGVAAVTESDTLFGSTSDSRLANKLLNGFSTTTIDDLTPNTTYSFKMFAYDTYGNKSNSGQLEVTTNSLPSGTINSAAEKTNGSGIIDIEITVDDGNDDDCQARIEYALNAECDFTSSLDPTLDAAPANISSNRVPKPEIDNLNLNQIGSSTRIITSTGANTVSFDWRALTDLGATTSAFCLRLTAFDGQDYQATPHTLVVTIDTAAPTIPGNLDDLSVAGMSVTLGVGASSTDANFSEYKIFYKMNSGGVTENDSQWNKNDDANLGYSHFRGATETTVTNLDQSTLYYFNIWAYDSYGNKASAAVEVSTSTVIVPSATWREAEDTPDPTAGSYLGKEAPVRVRIAVANSGDWNAESYFYRLEYAAREGECSTTPSWTTVPITAGAEHFEMISSAFFENYASTTARLSAGAYSFTPGYMVESPFNMTGSSTLAGGAFTEIEYDFQATASAVSGETYCFRVSDNGAPLDRYLSYPELTLSPPTSGTIGSAEQRTDGSGVVDVEIDVFDPDGSPNRARLEFATGTDCVFTSPGDPTLDETDDNITATYPDPAIDNAYPYQIGTSTGMIVTYYGTNTVAFDWQSQSDLSGYEGEYCLRLTANDLYDDQAVPATTTVEIDNKNPSTPGNLTVVSKTMNSVTLGFGTTSSDLNFREYVIYWKEGASGVSETDKPVSSSTDPDLSYADFRGTATTTIGGLLADHQYVFKIWAYDEYGNEAASLGEVTTKLVPSISGIVYAADGVTPILTAPTVSMAVGGVLMESAAASAVDGRFTFQDIDPPATGTPMMVFINGNAAKGATYSRYGGAGEVNDFNVYQNQVVMRHDDNNPLTLDNVDLYDSNQDTDIPCTVTDGSLSVNAGVKLYVWPGSTFNTGTGALTLRDVDIEGTFNASGTQVIYVSGDWNASNGTFNAASSTVIMNSVSAGRFIAGGGSAFYALTLDGAGGEWLLLGNATTTATTTITRGTLIHGGNNDFETQSLVIADGAVFTKATGTGKLIFEGPENGYFEDGNLTPNNLGNVQIGYSPAKTYLSSDFAGDSLTINSGDEFYTRGYDVGITGYISVHGTYDCLDTLAGDGTITTLGTDWTVDPGAFFIAGNSTTTFDGANGGVINSGGTDADHDFYHLSFDKSSATTTALAGDIRISGGLMIGANSTLDVSSSNFDIYAAGNWANSGTFTAREATTTFDALSTGYFIDPGASAFYNIIFDSSSGGWTITGNATSTNSWSLSDAQLFIAASGIFIEVGGEFLNAVGGGNTDWTGSTLYLNNGGNYAINTKSAGGDDYANLKIGANTDIEMWNSAAGTYDVNSTGSLYSMNYNAAAGRLRIYGDYHVSGGETAYWNYSDDFDGAPLGGSPRICQVELADGAAVTVDGGKLEIIGAAGASTTLANQGSGDYSLAVASGTLEASYYQIRNMDASGLNLSASSSVITLDYGDLELSANGGRLITLTADVINANPTLDPLSCRFATSSGISGYNVSLSGVPTDDWKFVGHYGNLSGEAYDADPGDPRGYILWDDSVEYTPKSRDWQWFHNADDATPTSTPAAGATTTPNIGPNNNIKLRLTIAETGGLVGEDVKMRLQYSTQADFSSDIHWVGEVGSTTSLWTYHDGAADNDNDPITEIILDDATEAATHNESGLSSSDYDHDPDTAAEWEFTIHNNGAALATTYYFRAYGSYYFSIVHSYEKAVVTDDDENYPSVIVNDAILTFNIGGLPADTVVDGVTTDLETTAASVPFGSLTNLDNVKEGAQRFTITTNSEYGYQLFVYQTQNLIANNGATIDPIPATNDTPGAWSIGAATGGFGYHTTDPTLSGSNPSRFSPPNTYARFNSSIEEISYSPLPVAGESLDFVYKLEVSSMQPAGEYETEVVYILVPTF
ncbi:MAG: hypothetical protein V1867_07800 [Candidatus Falkowbacteria bacterium]